MAQEFPDILQKSLDEGRLQLYNVMCEPGYSKADAKGYLLGDWNNYSQEFFEWLEGQNYVPFWEDEWTTCSECGGLVRIQADCWFWRPFYVTREGELLCGKCLMDDLPAYLLSLEGSAAQALKINQKLDLTNYGYVKVNESPFDAGLHSGWNADPAAMSQKLKDAGITRFLWHVSDVEQFGVHFDLYIHKDIQSALKLVRNLL